MPRSIHTRAPEGHEWAAGEDLVRNVEGDVTARMTENSLVADLARQGSHAKAKLTMAGEQRWMLRSATKILGLQNW
jgi:hypothetical protein